MPTAILWLTDQADVRCTHHVGRTPQKPSQTWVRIDGHPVIVLPDPIGRPIRGCPNIGIGIKPCTTTLPLRHGASGLVRIDGHPVIRGDLVGYTDGTPPGAVDYRVRDAGQTLVAESP